MTSFYKTISSTTYAISESVTLACGAKISFLESKVLIEMPFPSTESIFYKDNGVSLDISNDIRLLYDESDEIDSAGIASLLLLGAVVPPLTPFKKIKAFLPGLRYEINIETLEIKSQTSDKWSNPSFEDNKLCPEEQIQTLSTMLDNKIRTYSPSQDPIVLFSGGVDSSVLASRLSAMDWKKASLIHCSFGKHDPETDVAKSIASALGMPLDIELWDTGAGFESLEKAASLYRYPFCDQSCVPTHSLSQAVISKYSNERTILDGTGADGAFGLFGKTNLSKKLYSLPPIIRRSFGSLYSFLNLWKTPNKFEYYIRLLRRSSLLPELANSIALNPLVNISYYANPADIALVSSLCEDWIEAVSGSNKHIESIPMMDIGLVCARIFAQKNFSPFNSHNFQIEYPFLDHEMVDLALSHARFWPGSDEPKSTLKHLLASAVPTEFVYRKKSGFLAPMEEQFAHPVFIDHLKAVTDTNSPLYEIINRKMILQLIDYLIARKTLPQQTYNFLWGVAFSNAWLTQVKEVSPLIKNKYINNNI